MSNDSQDRPVTRRAATRQLLHHQRLRESLTLGHHPSLRNACLAGLQAAIAMAVCLPLFAISPWSHLLGFASLGTLVALFGRFAPRHRRSGIVLQCALWQTFAVFIMSAAVWLAWPPSARLVLLALSCGFFLLVSFRGKFGAPGPLIFIFAVGAAMTDSLSLGQLIERTAATAVTAGVAWLVCMASETLRHTPSAERPLPVEPEQPWPDLLLMAGRIALAALVIVFISDALGMNYPAWAAMAAVAVMQGRHLHISMHRALQRMVGTLAGAGLAWLLLAQQPSLWGLIAALVMMQVVTEIVIGFNYAFAQVLVTPMALLMTYLATLDPAAQGLAEPAAAIATLAPERVLDTLLGAGIGILVALALSSLEERRALARHHQADQ